MASKRMELSHVSCKKGETGLKCEFTYDDERGRRHDDTIQLSHLGVVIAMPMVGHEITIDDPSMIGSSGSYPMDCNFYEDSDGVRGECYIKPFKKLKDWFRENDPYIQGMEVETGRGEPFDEKTVRVFSDILENVKYKPYAVDVDADIEFIETPYEQKREQDMAEADKVWKRKDPDNWGE